MQKRKRQSTDQHLKFGTKSFIVSQTICVMFTCPKTELIYPTNDYYYYYYSRFKSWLGLLDENCPLKRLAKMFIYALFSCLIAHGLQ